MARTLLQIIQAVQGELGLPQNDTVTGGGADDTTKQMFALANRCVDELRRYKEDGWTALQFEYIVEVQPPIVTTGGYGMPNSQYIVNIPSTAGLAANYFMVSGTDLPQETRVAEVMDANTVRLNMHATNQGTMSGATFTFMQDTYPEPPGFDYFINQTMWDRTNMWELIGPDSAQRDQHHRSGIVSMGPRRHFRQKGPGIAGIGNNFMIWPPPAEIATPLQLVFEYTSKYSIVSKGNITNPTYTELFENDTDFCLLDDQAIIMGIKWLFWEIKGMGSYVALQNRWIDYVDRLCARDGAAPKLQLVKINSPMLITSANVQDGSYPGPVGG